MRVRLIRSGRPWRPLCLLLALAGLCLLGACAPRTLHAAIAAGKEERAIELAQKQKGLEERNHVQATPLHEAVARNQKKVIAALLEAGADVNARMPHGETPLYFVGRHDDRETLAMLVEAGADVNGGLHNGLTMMCAMFDNIHDEESYQASVGVASDLIAAGARPDLGTHSFELPPVSYAWGLLFLAERAAGSDDSLAATSFESAAALFIQHAEQQTALQQELTERAKGVTGRNIGRGFGSFLVGVATGVATLGLVTVIPDPGYESKSAIRARAEHAGTLAELYQQTSRKCRERLTPPAESGPGVRPDASLPYQAPDQQHGPPLRRRAA